MHFGLESVHVHGFRSARDVRVAVGPVCALIGDANAGKSNLLAALHLLLSQQPAIDPSDASEGGDGLIRIEGVLRAGGVAALEARAGSAPLMTGDERPPAMFLPAVLRAGPVVAPAATASAVLARAVETVSEALPARPADGAGASRSAPAAALVDAIQQCCERGLTGLVLMIEEPELYLRPQAQRYLHRVLRDFALRGNQVIYSTHSPSFLDVARLDELVLVDHHPRQGTRVRIPQSVEAGSDFRALSEFDAERSELFLARAAVLVEGMTEKLALPFVFRALGHDPDQAGISIVECGGKGNLLLFMRICRASGVPFVVIHDRDTRAHRSLNARIKAEAGGDRAIALEPDFEAIAHLPRGRHKPEQAWRRFSEPSVQVPEPLARAVEVVVALAKG